MLEYGYAGETPESLTETATLFRAFAERRRNRSIFRNDPRGLLYYIRETREAAQLKELANGA